MKQTHNPDYKAGDQERVKTKMNKTRHNMEVADEIYNKTNDDLLKKRLEEKNSRRQDALDKMSKEIEEDK